MTTPHLAIVILGVDDVDRSVAFYTQAFGWSVVARVPVYAELDTGSGSRVGLFERAAFGQNTGASPSHPPSVGTTATELYLHVEDVEDASARLLKAGARVLDAARARVWGDIAAYFADPDGNVVAVSKELDEHDDG